VSEYGLLYRVLNTIALLDATVIPGTVEAQFSLRIVPDQDLDTIVESLKKYIQISFNRLQSPNSLKVVLVIEALVNSDLPHIRSKWTTLPIGGLVA